MEKALCEHRDDLGQRHVYDHFDALVVLVVMAERMHANAWGASFEQFLTEGTRGVDD